MANVKIPGLPLTDSIKDTDLFEKVNTPEAVPTSQRATGLQVFGYIANKMGYVLADNRFPSLNFGDAADPVFSGKVNILIGNSQAGLQIKQATEDSFSFFEFFNSTDDQVATLDQSGNFYVTNEIYGGSLHAGNGFSGTFTVLTALPSTFKTVTVVNGIITGVA